MLFNGTNDHIGKLQEIGCHVNVCISRELETFPNKANKSYKDDITNTL